MQGGTGKGEKKGGGGKRGKKKKKEKRRKKGIKKEKAEGSKKGRKTKEEIQRKRVVDQVWSRWAALATPACAGAAVATAQQLREGQKGGRDGMRWDGGGPGPLTDKCARGFT